MRRIITAGAAALLMAQLAAGADASTKGPTDHGGWGPRDSWDRHFHDGNIFDDFDRPGRDFSYLDEDNPEPRDRPVRDCPTPEWSGQSDAAWQMIMDQALRRCEKRAEKPPVFERPDNPLEPEKKPEKKPERPITQPGPPDPAPIPAPAALPMLAGALGALAWLRRRRA